MAIKTQFQIFFTFLFLSINLNAQQLVVVNGGLFGSQTDFANVGIYNISNGSFTSFDTIRTNSVQDVLIEDNRYIYVAAQDSIVKYDAWTGERLAGNRFGAASTKKLGIYQNSLIVGNWYGASDGNLRIFDKNDLSFTDSIPEITKGATDFVIISNRAYIAQNNTNDIWADTLGYLAIVDLDNMIFLGNDTLSAFGDEIGRLVNVGDSAIYSINGVSNTISMLHLGNGSKTTVIAAAALNPKSTGASVFYGANAWYLPFNNGIGSYDLINNSVISADIITAAGSFAFAVDTLSSKIFVSNIDFSNQSSNSGIVYNLTGDSLTNFPVGYSPEVLGVMNSSQLSNTAESMAEESFFELYPNPSTDYINFRLSEGSEIFEIFDLNGRKVKTIRNTISDIIQIDIKNLPAGIYAIKAGIKVQKFIKI